MLGQGAAILNRPPHANGALDDGLPDPLAVRDSVAFTSSSSAALQTLPNGIPIGGCWITFTVDSDAYIHFGPNNSIVAASASVSWPIVAGIEYNRFINEKDAFFRIIRKTADGALKIVRSNL